MGHQTPLPSVAAIGFSVLSALGLSAQVPLYVVAGDQAAESLGTSVSGAGDVNGDGYDDMIVGAPFDDDQGMDSGGARVLSGLDGSVLYDLDGDSMGDLFGRSVSGAGDVNGDGYADFIIGAPEDDDGGQNAGRARVYSGQNGSVLYTFDGDSLGDRFGTAVNCAGDLNGDGYSDVIVGAPRDDDAGQDAGRARVFSGRDGSILYTFDGATAGEQFGWSVAGAGDTNGDCYDDVIVGAPRRSDGILGAEVGIAVVRSGLDGSVLRNFIGQAAGDHFGWSVAGGGDVDGDRIGDLVIGEPQSSNLATNGGGVRVYSGSTGIQIHSFDGTSAGDNLGWAVAFGGDLNADGRADILAGAPRHDPNALIDGGCARVWSGLDGERLYTFELTLPGDQLGSAVAAAGDINADGFADVLVGAPFNDENGDESGRVLVFALEPYDDIAEASTVAPVVTASGNYAFRIKKLGDVDNDGVEDYGVGAPFDLARFGTAWIYSGVNHSLIRSHVAPNFDSAFGARIGPVGDVNQDGHADYGVGGWHDDTVAADAGFAVVYSGFDGSVLYQFFGTQPRSHLGTCVGTLGDVDSDGVDDFFIGVGKHNFDAGAVWVYSGQSGTKLYEVNGLGAGDWYAWSGDGLGDVNGDGIGDFVVGAPAEQVMPTPGTGYAHVLSGVNGALIHSFTGFAAGDRFGWMVSNAGDIDDDGVADIIIGAHSFDPVAGVDAGQARVFSGASGALLLDLEGEAAGDGFGTAVAGAGDINGDGFTDLLVGAPLADPGGAVDAGRVYLFSGEDGGQLTSFDGEFAGDDFGRGLMGLQADSNADTYPEIVIGAPNEDDSGAETGTLHIFETSVKVNPAYTRRFGAGCPGSNGSLPQMSFAGRPALGESFDMQLRAAVPGVSVILGLDVAQINIPLGPGAPGCSLLVLPVFGVPQLADASGKVDLPVAVPVDPVFAGNSFYVEWVVIDPLANGLSVVLSNGGQVFLGNP